MRDIYKSFDVIPALPGFWLHHIDKEGSGARMAIIAWHVEHFKPEEYGEPVCVVNPITAESVVTQSCGIEQPDGSVVMPFERVANFPTVAAFHAVYPPWPIEDEPTPSSPLPSAQPHAEP